MAVSPSTYEYTFTTGGIIRLAELTNFPDLTWMGSLAVRASRDNTDDVFWSDGDGERGGYIGPAEGVTFNFGDGQALMDTFSFHGTSGDSLFITVGLNSSYFGG